MIKKVVIAVLICIFAPPFSVFGQGYYNSYEKYANLFPPVREQHGYENCWSFAATGAIEHSMVLKDDADFSEEGSLFSEWHMAAAMNSVEEELFEKYTRSHDVGGNREGAVAYLARSFASGPVSLKDYGEGAYKRYIDNYDGYNMLTLKDKRATLNKAKFLTARDEGSSFCKYDIEKSKPVYGKNEEVIEKIKNAVKEYGAVAVSYHSYERVTERYYNDETAAYCVPWEDYIDKKTPDGNSVSFVENASKFEKATNHAVLIVGWDDAYSHKNFKEAPVSFDGEKYSFEDGAWIVKNSWGENFGQDGFEYISYMEPTICQYATVYDMENTQRYEAVTHTQKGLMGSVKFPDVGYGVCAVNRFEKKGLINAVGIYVCDTKPSVQILIDNRCDDDLKKFTKAQFEKEREVLVDFETGKESNILTFENAGYYMLYLKEPVYSEGKFDIYVKYNVDEKSDVILPTGNNIGTKEYFVPSVTYWAHITGNDNVHKWKGIDVNWCVNVFTVSSDFEKIKAKVEDGEVLMKLFRYNPNEKCKVMAAFYDGDKVIANKSYIPTFDEYGYCEIRESMPKATKVKAIVWQQKKSVL